MEKEIRLFSQNVGSLLSKAMVGLESMHPALAFSIVTDEAGVHLSAFNEKASLSVPDGIELIVSVRKYSNGLYMVYADVAWDNQGGIEGQFSFDLKEVNHEVLNQVYLDIPRLIKIFETCLYKWEGGRV